MHTKASALIALPAAVLLALSLGACDEETVTTSTASSSLSGSDPSASLKDKSPTDSDDASATPSPKARTSSSASVGSSADPSARVAAIEDLKVGDCVSEIATDTQNSEKVATEATVVDCSAPHRYEMVGNGQSTAATYTEADTDSEISTVCKPLMSSYVGSPAKAEDYRILAVAPSQETWDQGDRTFVCFAQKPDGSPLNNSIKNS